MTENTWYVGAEFAEPCPRRNGKTAILTLTTADVTRATGINIATGMTIEHRYNPGRLDVRVWNDRGTMLADWTTVDL